ncbi:MAG: tetratricopeptide repeat protein [Deltaproteobacteria bacterium]|nr:tetratricopeptide repeat protein [Deltaproteobacteria bacterium]
MAEEGPLAPVFVKKIQKALESLPPEQVKKIKKQVGPFLTGEMKWVDLFTLPPEKLHEIAEEGYHQFQNARYDKAEIIYKGLAILDPDNYYYHSMLGAIYQRQEKWPEAVLEYSIAVDVKPDDTVSYTNRGEVYFKLGLYDEARIDLKKAAGRDPKQEDAWGNRARMLLKQMETIEKVKK